MIVPDRITSDLNVKFEKLKRSFDVVNVSFRYTGRPRNITLDTQIRDESLEFVDFPTTISGINYAISNLLPNEFNQLSSDYELIVERELNKFITTLKQLLLRDGFDDMGLIIKEIEL